MCQRRQPRSFPGRAEEVKEGTPGSPNGMRKCSEVRQVHRTLGTEGTKSVGGVRREKVR